MRVRAENDLSITEDRMKKRKHSEIDSRGSLSMPIEINEQ